MNIINTNHVDSVSLLKMARWCYVFLCLCTCVYLLHETSALYEDQVGLYDWYQQYVGPVSYASIDSTVSTNRGIVVASENGVLAHIDTLSGDLVWRKVFAPGRNGWIDAILRTPGGSLLSVSKNGRVLRSWELDEGLLKWEVVTNLTASQEQDSPLPLNEIWRPGAVQAALTGGKQSLVAVAAGEDLSVHSVKTGEVKWTHTLNLPNESLLCSMRGQEKTLYVLAAVDESNLILFTFAASTGELTSTRELTASWLSMDTVSCLLTTTHLVCLELSKLNLYHTPLSASTPLQQTMLTTLLEQVVVDNQQAKLVLAGISDNVGVEIGSTQWLLSLEGPQVSVLSKSGHAVSLVGGVTVGGDGRTLVVGDKEVELKEYRGKPLLGGVQSDKGRDRYRMVLVMEDHSILGINQDGVMWAREDALGAAVAVEMLDLPAGQSEKIESFVEMTKSEANPLKVAALRAQLQFTLAKEFLMNLNKEVASLLQYDGPHLVRDRFNTRKLILVTTANGKMYALDSRNGEVVWQSFLSSFAAFQDGRPLLHVLRTTSHPPHPSLAVLVGRSQTSGCSTVIYEFNPLTGEAMNSEPHCLPFQITQTLLLPTLDHTHSKILLLLTSDNMVATYPSSTEVMETLMVSQEQLYLLVAIQGGSDITGYRVLLDEGGLPSPDNSYPGYLFRTEQFWQVRFPVENEQIAAVVGKKAYEHVSSQGDVLADRNVQYKYLNPNLVGVVTESTDRTKPLVTVYLIDSITGAIIYHTSHKNALGPVHMAHSENWVVYEFFNSKQRRHELVVLELYEIHTNQSHTVWSSLAPPPTPAVMSQAYTLPTTITTLTTTQTLRGITYKGVIFGLASGRVVIMPKSLLNHRRELEITDQMKEDGTPPYHPEIPLNPLSFVNYNRTVARIREIYATPSGLESTCLLFVCGLDLYYTRVTPSNQFDLLAEDFDYTLISAVVVGMFVATLVLSRLSAKKMLKSLWK